MDSSRVSSAPTALIDRLVTAYETAGREGAVVELAIGRRPGVAAALAARGIDVVATDIEPRPVPASVSFVRDDLLAPERSTYADAVLLYARNLPAELQRPARDLAVSIGAPLYFTTLGMAEPVFPVERDSLEGSAVRETLFRAVEEPV